MTNNIPKFSKIDKSMIERRGKFFNSTKITPQFSVDNWGLLAGELPISSYLATYEIMKTVLDVPGHICEFGVFNGANLLYMSKIMNFMAPNDLKKIFGFDSFKGLTEFSKNESKVKKDDQGAYKGNKKLLEEMIELHGLEDRVVLVEGLIEKTLKKFLNQNPHYLFSLIYIDTDLYSSTKIILESTWDRLSPRGVIVFDEGYHDRFPGEGAAAQEFLKTIKGEYDLYSLPFARQPMFYIKKKS